MAIDEEGVALAGDWEHLPYLVWFEIFEQVAAPLRDSTARLPDITNASRSLLSAALANRMLTKPALTALYKSPILSPLSAHYLARNFTLPPDATTFNYRPMVETLRIDVDETLARKFMGKYLEIKDLIQNLPRLVNVELYHNLDQPPYRNLDDTVRWKYPAELFEALQPVPNGDIEATDKTTCTQLRSWLWSSRLAGELCSLDKLQEIHLLPSFASLRKIAFVNYQVPSIRSKTRDPVEIEMMDLPHINQLAAAIKVLPRLEHLIMESSTMVNAHLLEMLPGNLKHIELINCWDIEADSFAMFLVTHGRSLQSLTLDHCQSLSLAFLPVLASACPKLISLHMDMSYYRHHEHYNDSEPLYDVLLGEDQVPTWPPTLQYVDMQHLRQWAGKDEEVQVEERRAKLFFESLERSASSLPALRKLVLKAMLNVPFRRRAEFRDHWVTRLTDVFKRPSTEPLPRPRLRLIVPIRRNDQKLDGQESAASQKSTSHVRRSSRIAEILLTPPSHDDEGEERIGKERSQLARFRKEAKRLKIQPSRTGHEADDEESEDELAATSLNNETAEDSVRGQLLCDIVDIQIDNQKPSEHQYGMDDFLDTPTASDAEWDGTDEVFD